MGVAGSGKTEVGRALAAELGWPFYDGDDFHPLENVAKMARGIPLDDADRAPWLQILRDLLAERRQAGEQPVLACSALKEAYRDRLREGNPELMFVHLHGDLELIWSRMQERQDHYMRADMLQSQFDVLEPPADALLIDIARPVPEIVEKIVRFVVREHEVDRVDR
jgi:gluconokinase